VRRRGEKVVVYDAVLLGLHAERRSVAAAMRCQQRLDVVVAAAEVARRTPGRPAASARCCTRVRCDSSLNIGHTAGVLRNMRG
jgi:hypothetical protein